MFEIKNLKIETGYQYEMLTFLGLQYGKRRVASHWVASCDIVELLSGKRELFIAQHYDLSLPKEEVYRKFVEEDARERCKTLCSELTQLVLASLKEDGRWEVVEYLPHSDPHMPFIEKLTVNDRVADLLWVVTRDRGRYPSPTKYKLEAPFGIPPKEQNVVAQALCSWYERDREQKAKQKQEAGYNDLLKLYKQEGKDET